MRVQITYDSNKNYGIQLTLSKEEIKEQANSITKGILFVYQFALELAEQISDDADEQDSIVKMLLNNALDITKDFFKKSSNDEE